MIVVRLAEAGMSNEVRVEPHEGWRKLVLNRPDRLNAAGYAEGARAFLDSRVPAFRGRA